MNTQVVQTLTKLEKCGNSQCFLCSTYLFIYFLFVNIILLILTTELISVFLKTLPA